MCRLCARARVLRVLADTNGEGRGGGGGGVLRSGVSVLDPSGEIRIIGTRRDMLSLSTLIRSDRFTIRGELLMSNDSDSRAYLRQKLDRVCIFGCIFVVNAGADGGLGVILVGSGSMSWNIENRCSLIRLKPTVIFWLLVCNECDGRRGIVETSCY